MTSNCSGGLSELSKHIISITYYKTEDISDKVGMLNYFNHFADAGHAFVAAMLTKFYALVFFH